MQIYQSLLALSGLSFSVVHAQQPINEKYNFKIALRWREGQWLDPEQFAERLELLCSQYNVADIYLDYVDISDGYKVGFGNYANVWTELSQARQQQILEKCPGFGIYVPFTILNMAALAAEQGLGLLGAQLCRTVKDNAFTGLELNNLDAMPLTDRLIELWQDLIQGCSKIQGVDLRVSSLDLYYNVTASETGTLRIVDVLKNLPENARPSRFAIQRYEDYDGQPIIRNTSYEGVFLDPQDGVKSLLEAYDGYVGQSTFQVKVPLTQSDDIGGANWVDGPILAASACRAHDELGWTAGYFVNAYHSFEPKSLPGLLAITSPCQ